ncbi:MAG: hypothetical protein ABJB61_07615 [bacterium]
MIATRNGSAATPSNGTISVAAPVLSYDAGPFTMPNQSPLGLGQLEGPRCNDNTFPCDNYTLTVTLPAGYIALHPNASVKVTMYWTDIGAQQSDYDLYMYRGIVTTLNGSQQADYQAASGANPEVGSISPLADGTNQYSLKIVPYVTTLETVHVRMELLEGTGSICLESSASYSQPATGPGQTSNNSSSVSGGQQSSSSFSAPANVKEISVLAEASGGLPIKLLLVNPAGLTLKTVDSTNGIAVLSAPVTPGGLYTIKVVNVNLGPVSVWTVATPLVSR